MHRRRQFSNTSSKSRGTKVSYQGRGSLQPDKQVSPKPQSQQRNIHTYMHTCIHREREGRREGRRNPDTQLRSCHFDTEKTNFKAVNFLLSHPACQLMRHTTRIARDCAFPDVREILNQLKASPKLPRFSFRAPHCLALAASQCPNPAFPHPSCPGLLPWIVSHSK